LVAGTMTAALGMPGPVLVLYLTAIEASTAFAKAAQDEAQELGWSDKVEVRRGNFVDLAESVPEHDIVTLDRVICCYHDMQSLVRLSAARAVKFYGVVYPRDVLWNKIAFRFMNLFFWISRSLPPAHVIAPATPFTRPSTTQLSNSPSTNDTPRVTVAEAFTRPSTTRASNQLRAIRSPRTNLRKVAS